MILHFDQFAGGCISFGSIYMSKTQKGTAYRSNRSDGSGSFLGFVPTTDKPAYPVPLPFPSPLMHLCFPVALERRYKSEVHAFSLFTILELEARLFGPADSLQK